MNVIKSLIFFLILALVQFSSSKEIVIGFGDLVHDREILNLMQGCSSKIKALWYTTPYGGGGSTVHREIHDNSEFIKVSRQNLENMLGKYGYVMTGINLKLLYESLTLQDIKSSKKLKKYITGLLNSFYQQKLSYHYIHSGKPIYFGALIDLPYELIPCIKKHKLVKGISVNEFPLFTKFLKYVPYYFKPKDIPEKYIYPALKNIKAKDLYEFFRKTVKDLKKDELFNKYVNTEEFKRYILNSQQYYFDFMNKMKLESMSSTYFPNEGRLFYSGSTTVRSDGLIWYLPGDWSVNKPGYEHDLVAKGDYFTSCNSWSDLPDWYDDCETACISEISGDYCAFSFGTYDATLIEADWPYTGIWTMTRGSANFTDFRLNAQEVFHSPKCFKVLNSWICLPCPFDTPWCMGGTPLRDGNPALSCPRNSLILKQCQFRRLYPYSSFWTDKYDCTDAILCD